jgi:hypothetical protein
MIEIADIARTALLLQVDQLGDQVLSAVLNVDGVRRLSSA